MGRQVLLQILTFGGGIVLARVLSPAQFGLYAIATFLVGTFALFGDFGLAPSFIQRKEELTEKDLRVGFTLQQIITSVIVVALFAAAPWLARLYPKAPPETVWLVRTLAFSLYLTSWRSMSALQLERHLRYDRLAWIEVVETLSYQGLAVGLALAGYGVWSFVWATLVRGLLGTVLTYAAAPWSVRFGYDRETVREIIRYGIPFQMQMIIHSMGGWVTPILVGGLIGPQAVGYLTWASSNGKKPLILVDNIVRVVFPQFSRLQEDRAELEKTLSRYFCWLLMISGLWIAVVVAAGPSLVQLIYTEKWLPAVPALIIFSFCLCGDIISWLLTTTLNSLNLVKFATRIYVIRSFANLLLTVILVLAIGLNGVPLAQFISVNITMIWLFAGLGQGSMRRIMAPVSWLIVPVIGSTAMGLLVAHTSNSLLWRAACTSIVTVAIYGVIVWFFGPSWLTNAVRTRLGKMGLLGAATTASV